MDEIIIRNARLADVVGLMDFWSRAGENAARPADRPDVVKRLIQRDPGALIIAELDGRVVGTIIAGGMAGVQNLYRLAVDPAFRGRGLGRRILAVAENRLKALGAEHFCAMVLNDNVLGQSLWTSTNYIQQDDWRRWVKAAH